VAAACLLALSGCGGTSGPAGQDVALVLEGAPTAADAGIALAVDRDYASGNGLVLTVRSAGPTGPSSALRQVIDGRAGFAVLDVAQLATPAARRRDLVAVAAVVQLPYARPVPPRPAARAFAAPARGLLYPQLVVVAPRDALQDAQPVAEALVETLRRGYEETIADPASAVAAMVRQNPALRTPELTAQLAAVSPAFTTGVDAWGDFSRADVTAWARAQRPPLDPTLAFWFGGGTSID